jgi:hypothetical protein
MALLTAIVDANFSAFVVRRENVGHIKRLLRASGNKIWGLDPVMEMLTLQEVPETSPVLNTAFIIRSMMDSVLEVVVLPVLKSVEDLPEGLPLLLRRMFYCEPAYQPFYKWNGATKPDTMDAEGCEGKWARIPESGASSYFVHLLNFFGCNGGYKTILRRMYDDCVIMSLSELRAYTSIFTVGKWCYTRRWYFKFWKRFYDGLQRRLHVRNFHLVGFQASEAAQNLKDIETSVNAVISTATDGGIFSRIDTSACLDGVVKDYEWVQSARNAWLQALVLPAL